MKNKLKKFKLGELPVVILLYPLAWFFVTLGSITERIFEEL